MAERNAERVRDAERTKEAILVAAEDRFARLGFEGTSLQEIADAADVARSTPAYFFQSKQALYDAVLRRALNRGREAMQPAFEAAGTTAPPEQALDILVGRFLDFLAGDENYVLLVQREALAPQPSLPALV